MQLLGENPAQLHIEVRSISIPGAPELPGKLRVECPLSFVDGGSTSRCQGSLWVDGRLFALDFREAADGRHITLSEAGAGSLGVHVPAQQGSPLGITLSAVDIAWLSQLPVLAGRLALPVNGRVNGRLQLDFPDAAEWRLAGNLAFSSLATELAEGSVVGENLGFGGPLSLQGKGEAVSFSVDWRIQAGELLAGALYLDFDEGAISMQIQGEWDGAEAVAIRRFQLEDPGRLAATGSLDYSLAEDGGLGELKVEQFRAQLPGALQRYGMDLLASAGFAGLQSEGVVSGSLHLGASRLEQLALDLQDLWLEDAQQRFSVAGASGTFGLGSGDAQRRHRLDWQGLAVFGFPIEGGHIELEQLGRGLRLLEPAQFRMLGGSLGLDRFLWRPASGEGSDSFGLSLSAHELSMVELSKRLGWPQMGGTITGSLPGVQYVDGVVSADGSLDVALFDGELRIDQLKLERPFGVLPTFSADLRARGLDLMLVTGTFEFGAMEGRLDADVLGLRMLNWEPVAFDAFLRTSTTAPGRRRISQRAVNSLSSVGGAGGVAALSQTALRFFENFRYEQVGLRCRLRNNVCEMSGVAPAENGYYIVKGSGLPQLNVIGFQSHVDWPVLLARLAQVGASEGVRVGDGDEGG